jgi:RNA polymerase primary sigma factor
MQSAPSLAERRLVRAARAGDRNAREQVILDYARLVRGMSARYSRLGLPFEDLVQEGTIGLLEAVDTWEEDRGASFETYARWHVRRALTDALTSQARLVRLPKQVTERRRAVARTASELAARTGRTPTPDEITAETGLPLDAVEAIRALPSSPASLDEAVSDDGATLLGLIGDPAATDPETEALAAQRRDVLAAAVARLPERQRTVIERRYGLGCPAVSLADLSRELGLCPQRTRSIEQTALFRLAKMLERDPTFRTPAWSAWTVGSADGAGPPCQPRAAASRGSRRGRPLSRRVGAGSAVAALVVAAGLALPRAERAGAAYPGSPGRIATAIATPGHRAEIWTVSPTGERPRRVVRLRTDAVAPSWSSDGRRLVFVSGGAVWRVNGDGKRLTRVTRRSVSDAESPAWAPGGKRIVFSARTAGANFDIYVIRTDGSGLRRLTRSRLSDEHPTWSPDGRRILFGRAASSVGSELWMMKADGSEQRRIGPGRSPDWSPDGKLVAFSLGEAIAVMRVDGSALERLVTGPGAAGDPAWSPDGRRIVFWSDRSSGEATKGDLYSITLDGASTLRITDQPQLWHFEPSWQPLALATD